MQKRLLLTCFIGLSALVFSHTLRAQCTTQVTHLSGTQLVTCTNVTVTSSGSAVSSTLCGKGPYLVGNIAPGSYTFNFSPAISGVKVGVAALNNNALGLEEIAFTVNGSFYPITIPGVPDGCFSPAVISGTGTIQACTNCVGSWDNIVINQTMSSLKVEDVWLTGGPVGVVFSLYICCPACSTDAGVLTASPISLCLGAGNVATIPPATQTFLDNNDLLRYILFSNLNDTLGSIVATSATPSFTFNPATMQSDQTYYIAAIAGNNLNGNVDLNDACLNISNAVSVIWRSVPTVTFSVANPNVCAGACTTVTANFTGTPPFSLTYSISGAGSYIQTFSGNTGTFQVCAAAGSPPGSLVVQATRLETLWCVCN
ncbi:MAG: hypothetical protein WCR52_13560 [Bacteroidota bacterium]|uniref:hypothetical protein n=1 Tax=Runella sp. TaxID=1960881 RepID=UPI00301AA856